MLQENLNVLDEIISQQIQIIEDTPDGDDRNAAIDSLCKMLNKTNEAWKIYEEQLNNETRAENDRVRTVMESEAKAEQSRNDRVRSILDFSKTLLSIAAFVTFEVLAHESEMNDILPRNLMHPAKNPIKLRL